MAKKQRLWNVILFNRYSPEETRVETVSAQTADDAEEMMHDEYFGIGWGVADSFPVFKKGDRVKWNDPGIDDYDPADREYAKNRVFEIVSEIEDPEDENEIVLIAQVGGGSEAEVYAHELELCTETPLRIRNAFIYKNDVKRAEQVLIDNGIEADEASTVLQAIGYVLLDTELYGNDVSIELHNSR